MPMLLTNGWQRSACVRLADLLAPSSLVIADDQLVIDGEYTRVLAVADLPLVVAAGWLKGVLAEQLAIDLSMHIRPLDGVGQPAL